MKLSTTPKGFLGIDQGKNFQAPYHKAKTVIIPFGMESHISYGAGTRRGPQAILKASHELNENDEQTFTATYKTGICTLQEPKIPKDSKKALELLYNITDQTLKDRKFPLVLGGEHALTPAVVRAVCKKFQDVCVLHFDAHADLRKQYRGSIYSHASALRRVVEDCPVKQLVQVGIRTVSEVDDELSFIQKNKEKIKVFWGYQKFSPGEILKSLPTKNVYITFDVDAFDPSIMPATGTPEPGGLLWWQTLDILKTVFGKKNVVGVDIVEHSPIKGLSHPDFLIARLVYKIIGYKFS